MKVLGNRSISSVLGRLITLLWYLEFLLLLTPPLVFMDDDGIRYSWPVTLDANQASPTVKPVSDRILDFKLSDALGVADPGSDRTLSFEDSTVGRRLLQTLHNLVYIGLIMFVTWQLKKIFSSFSADQPFMNSNSTKVKWIAFSVLFLVFFDVLETILHHEYTISTIILSGATFNRWHIDFDFRTFILGLLLLIIGEVFRKGYEYQVDSESIL